MYLKQLVLRGFKSFASATTLDFEPGITCIVGPNGSGKSNVVDALSWVMGEQGAKSLRGGKMEDVIFAGTSSRAPLGRAEVQLTIDNSDGALPIDYAEVTITRTMFRSGGSEYAINGAPARLLDVTELLSDSGIGREMHVIVGQGQLDAILAATPESRRGFIEEAAGVLKHRKRKEKALRKLEGMKGNLDRLQDLIGELQRQLKPLGRQAEAARKAQLIQAELRDAKARLLADDLEQANAALAADLADEQAALAAQEQAKAEAERLARAEEEAELRLRDAGRIFDACQEQWYVLAGLKERIASTASVAAERMKMGQAQPMLEISSKDPEQLEAEAARARARETELQRSCDQAKTQLEQATQARTQAEAEHNAAEQSYAAQLRAVADRREGLARLNGQLASIQSRCEASQGEEQRLLAGREAALARAQAAAEQYHQAECSLAGLGDNESRLDQAWQQAEQTVAEYTSRVHELEAVEAELGRDRASLNARCEALRLATQQRDGSADLESQPQILGRLLELIRIQPGWEQAVAAALGPVVDAVVAEDLPAALAALAHLAEAELGRAWVVVADDTRQQLPELIDAPARVSSALAALLGDVHFVSSRDEALRVLTQQPQAIAITREGERISKAVVEGGSAASPSVLTLNAQLVEAEEQLAEVTAGQDRLRFDLNQAREQLAQAQLQQQTALAALHESDAQLTAVTDALGAHRQAQAAANREAERLEQAIVAARETQAGHQQKLRELQARVEAASADELAEPDPSQRDALAVTARLTRQQEMDARLALRTAEEQARAMAGRADALLRSAAAERRNRAKAQAKAEQLRREAEVAQAVHEAATRLLASCQQVLERADQERAAAEQERIAAQQHTTATREAARAANARVDELLRGAHRDELARIEHRMRIEQLAERSLTELGLEAETLLADYGTELLVPVLTRPDGEALTEDDEVPEPQPYDRATQEKRLRRAERGLSLLGKINPLALEEFEALQTRHGFLAEQLADLKRTREDLLALIEDVDARVQEVFQAAYRDVEAAFTQVFERLFPGGQGKLVLTDPGNWLETGVDVEARPAGKQVKRLSLLSGGERSLVAVAFLVSLFIARPSPFYILDEVEAALDDANLGRLLSIYEELRVNSQLLVITHQKRTMEIADSLYGVTMRGDGISTVVSQRLN